MRLTSRGVWFAVAPIVLCLILTRPSLALTFSSSCDRFEIDGNTFGPADGSPDFVDAFDSGTLAPNWSVLLGSAEETGSDVVAHSPGTDVQLGPTLFEISTVENVVHEIDNGAGNFTMTSYWEPTLPGINDEVFMQLYSDSPIIEAAGLAVNNFSSQVAMQQGNGALAGYSISRSLTHGVGAGFTTVQSDSAPIDPAGLTPNSPPPPPPAQRLPLRLLLVKNPSGPTSRRVQYKAVSPHSQGNFLRGDPTTGGATLNVKLDAVTQCFSMPASGWSRNGRSYKYVDAGGAHGPVMAAQWREAGSGAIVNKVLIMGSNGQVDIVPPNPGVQADTNFHVGGGADYCASTAGGTIRPNDAPTFKARNAPAPATCNVTACSP